MRFFAGLGRILISLIFILLGVFTIIYWDIADTELSGVLTYWEHALREKDTNNMFAWFLSMRYIILIVAIFLQLLGGILLFFSAQVRLGAFLLLLYLIPATILYQHFWFLEGDKLMPTMLMFFKNLAIIGGLLVVLAYGSGKRSKNQVAEFEDE